MKKQLISDYLQEKTYLKDSTILSVYDYSE